MRAFPSTFLSISLTAIFLGNIAGTLEIKKRVGSSFVVSSVPVKMLVQKDK